MDNNMSHSLETSSLHILQNALSKLEAGFAGLPSSPPALEDEATIIRIMDEVATKLQDNYPYFHPLYAGQMLKPPHPIARLAYMLAMWINPNNHALDGGRASSHMEKEAVAALAGMVGWKEHLGHLCSGGTVANLEALWIAGQLKPGSTVVASEQAHYTHSRISAVLRLPFESIESDSKGRMDLQALLRRLEAGGVGTVVVTIGTTATGAVDYLPQILKWRDQFGFRAHADAAYGGYFKLADNLSNETKESFEHLAQVDSIVIDPHKHGLQPYGCGCVIFRDPSVGRFYKHDSPYTYFSSKELHLGEISLECSRAGASAVGLWATQRLLPMVPGGKFAQNLVYCHDSAIDLYRRLDADYRFLTAFPPELDILIWAVRASRVSQASDLARRIFDEAAKLNLHLALAEMPIHFFNIQHTGMVVDAPRITCLRSVLMKPEHKNWVENIWQLLDEATYRASEAG